MNMAFAANVALSHQPINQYINQPVNRAFNWPINQPISQSINQLPNMAEWVERPSSVLGSLMGSNPATGQTYDLNIWYLSLPSLALGITRIGISIGITRIGCGISKTNLYDSNFPCLKGPGIACEENKQTNKQTNKRRIVLSIHRGAWLVLKFATCCFGSRCWVSGGKGEGKLGIYLFFKVYAGNIFTVLLDIS